MSTGLSLAGIYRGKLVEILHHSDVDIEYGKLEREIRQILDDDYVRGIPPFTYLLITFMDFNSVVTRDIVQVKMIKHETIPNAWSSSIVMDVYGTDSTYSEAIGESTYEIELRCTRIIEYKLLDVLDAPLFINWYWLSSFMKVKLFDV
jgi:hypothetical protein